LPEGKWYSKDCGRLVLSITQDILGPSHRHLLCTSNATACIPAYSTHAAPIPTPSFTGYAQFSGHPAFQCCVEDFEFSTLGYWLFRHSTGLCHTLLRMAHCFLLIVLKWLFGKLINKAVVCICQTRTRLPQGIFLWVVKTLFSDNGKIRTPTS
jgi:hypothetical protein